VSYVLSDQKALAGRRSRAGRQHQRRAGRPCRRAAAASRRCRSAAIGLPMATLWRTVRVTTSGNARSASVERIIEMPYAEPIGRRNAMSDFRVLERAAGRLPRHPGSAGPGDLGRSRRDAEFRVLERACLDRREHHRCAACGVRRWNSRISRTDRRSAWWSATDTRSRPPLPERCRWPTHHRCQNESRP
jgi:hypothetical protein